MGTVQRCQSARYLMLSNTARPCPKASSAATRPLGGLFLFFLASSAIIALYALSGAVKNSALELPLAHELNPVLWMPEGWKFFTRDSREARTEMYIHDINGWHDASRGPNARPENKFGLDRIGRAQGIELGLITDRVPHQLWRPCNEGNAFRCLDQASVARRVSNVSPSPSLCGEVGLISRKPLPWAWANQGFHVSMPLSFVRLEVQC
jgi:antimicrobial peptide system SdpA family protein